MEEGGTKHHQKAQLSVVISNLPPKTNMKQISTFCNKIGLLATHPETGDDLILLNASKCKATVTFAYPEGANQAIEYLNGEQFSDGYPVTVERAPREPFDFSKWKLSMRLTRKYHSYMGGEEELDSTEQKRVKICILKNAFTPAEMIKDPNIYGKIVKDLTQFCEKFGKVTLVKPIEFNPEGIVIVRFETQQSASIAIGEMDGVEYRNRKLAAEPWDGKEIKSKETKEEQEKRLENFHELIDNENELNTSK